MSASESRWHALPTRPRAVALLILGFTVFRLLLAAFAPLLPQEAYYWSWSLHPDWSYFDHPPLASYSIWLTTALFGQTVFGIKSAAVFWSLGWNILWARLVLDMYGDRRLAFWSLAALNLTFLFEALGVGPTPDGPLIFAWSGALWAVWRLSQTGQVRWWWLTGFFVGLAMLGKYSGVLLGPVLLIYLLTSPRQRFWLLRPQPYLSALVALAVFTPVLIWNAQNDWVSLAFQSSRRVGDMGGFKPRYFLMLMATQLAILTPYGFWLAFGALVREGRKGLGAAVDDRTRLLLLAGAVPVLLFTFVSFRSIAKINWLAPAYVTLMMLGVRHVLAQTAGKRGSLRQLKWGLTSSAALLVLAGGVFLVPNLPIAGDLNSWSGWPEAAKRVAQIETRLQAEGKETFVFGPNYKVSSLLRFHTPGNPRMYAQDVYGEKALQFDYFPLPRDLRGATGIFVVSDQYEGEFNLPLLKTYFKDVQKVDSVAVKGLGNVTRRIDIYLCTDYRGHPRQNGRLSSAATTPHLPALSTHR